MMRMIENKGVVLATDTFGNPDDETILLVMGATASMLGWPDMFCEALAGHGYHVIRFDHRDTGQSTTVPPGASTYDVEDMAADAIAILDAYACDRAHLVGMSLGGFIAQMLALMQPDRVQSLTVIASEPLGWDGEPLSQIAPAFLDHFGGIASLDWSDRDAVGAFLLKSQQLCAGSSEPFEQDREASRIARVMSRTDSIASMFNHASVGTRQDWTGRFRQIGCPALIIHGSVDPILPIQNGIALAKGIARASLMTLPDVGHEIPWSAIPDLASRIADHAWSSSIRS